MLNSLDLSFLTIVFLPLLGGIILMLRSGKSEDGSRKAAIVISLFTFVNSLQVFSKLSTQEVNLSWVPSLGINFHFAMDGISALMVFLTCLLVPLILLSTKNHTYKNANVFYGLVLMMQTGLLGVFTAADGFLFYVFWELALIPIYFIAALWGGENRIKITFKFFIYTIVGSLFMLVAILFLGIKGGSFDIQSIYAAGASADAFTQSWVFWCFFIAFAIKMPIFPFHTWQPDTYTESPTPATMLLSGIMLKMGIYGVIRWLLPVVPMGVAEWKGVAMTLSIIGILYASLIAIVQTDAKRLVAYSSIAHVGLISAGVFSLTNEGMQGAVMQMLAHGINVVGMFFVLDIIYRRTGTRNIADLGGISHKAPTLAILAMIIMLGTIALPLTNGFIGEFLLLLGVYSYGPWAAAFAGLTIILGAVYMLNMFKNVMYGEVKTATANFTDVDTSEKIVLVVIAILIIAMGVYPKFFLDVAQPAIEKILTYSVIK